MFVEIKRQLLFLAEQVMAQGNFVRLYEMNL